MRNKKYFIFVARLAPENASIFVETRGGIRFPRVRARARTTALRREIHRDRNENMRIRYAAGRGRPALPTASSDLKPNVRVVISSVSREIPCGRNGTKHTRAGPPRLWRLATEKSPAIGTKTIVHDYPEYLPAGAPCRAGPLAGGGSPLARAGSAPRTPVFLPFGQIKYRKVVYK